MKDVQKPNLGQLAAEAQAERLSREAAALRENLRRRKAQARQQARAREASQPKSDAAPDPQTS